MASKNLVIHPVGGLESIGTSACLLDDGEKAILIDAGGGFNPALGPLLPESERLTRALPRLAAVFLTHGHFDHAAGVELINQQTKRVDFVASQATHHFLKSRYGLSDSAQCILAQEASSLRYGDFSITPLGVKHSIPGALAFLISHSDKNLLFTGDFSSFSRTALDLCAGKDIDLLFCDSTNASLTQAGPDEASVALLLSQIVENHSRARVLFTCFSSNLERIKKVIDLAKSNDLRVKVEGEAMRNSLKIISDLWPEFRFSIDPESLQKNEKNVLAIISGSQGHEDSALIKLLNRDLGLTEQDAIIISANPIPGNEEDWRGLLDLASSHRAVLYASPFTPIHASGHATGKDIISLLKCLNPKLTLPVHGNEFQRRTLLKEVAKAGHQGFYATNQTESEIPGFPGLRFFGNSQARAYAKHLGNAYERSLMARCGIALLNIIIDHAQKRVSAYFLTRGCLKADKHLEQLNQLALDCEAEVLDYLSQGVLATRSIRQKITAWSRKELSKRFNLQPLIFVVIHDYGSLFR